MSNSGYSGMAEPPRPPLTLPDRQTVSSMANDYPTTRPQEWHLISIKPLQSRRESRDGFRAAGVR